MKNNIHRGNGKTINCYQNIRKDNRNSVWPVYLAQDIFKIYKGILKGSLIELPGLKLGDEQAVCK